MSNPFHDHLDVCERCRTRPFDLCSDGIGLLHRAATQERTRSPVRHLVQVLRWAAGRWQRAPPATPGWYNFYVGHAEPDEHPDGYGLACVRDGEHGLTWSQHGRAGEYDLHDFTGLGDVWWWSEPAPMLPPPVATARERR